jgi:flagellar motor switch protein FliG
MDHPILAEELPILPRQGRPWLGQSNWTPARLACSFTRLTSRCERWPATGCVPAKTRLHRSMISNRRKAAIVLLSLPEEEAARIIRKLPRPQVELISIEIARTGQFTSEEQEEAICEFAEANANSLGSTAGGLDVAKNLLAKALGNAAHDVLQRVQQSVESPPFSFLTNFDSRDLLTIADREHPQTIALILSYLPPDFGADVIAGLSSERRLAVVARMARMGQTRPEIIKQIEEDLESRMPAVSSQSLGRECGSRRVAEILNASGCETASNLLEELSHEDPELVGEIRRIMSDLANLTKFSEQESKPAERP